MFAHITNICYELCEMRDTLVLVEHKISKRNDRLQRGHCTQVIKYYFFSSSIIFLRSLFGTIVIHNWLAVGMYIVQLYILPTPSAIWPFLFSDTNNNKNAKKQEKTKQNKNLLFLPNVRCSCDRFTENGNWLVFLTEPIPFKSFVIFTYTFFFLLSN